MAGQFRNMTQLVRLQMQQPVARVQMAWVVGCDRESHTFCHVEPAGPDSSIVSRNLRRGPSGSSLLTCRPSSDIRIHPVTQRGGKVLGHRQSRAQGLAPRVGHLAVRVKSLTKSLTLQRRGRIILGTEPVSDLQQITHLLEGEIQRLHAPNHHESTDVGLCVETEAALAAGGGDDEADFFVVPDRAQRQSCPLRDLADLHVPLLRHTAPDPLYRPANLHTREPHQGSCRRE